MCACMETVMHRALSKHTCLVVSERLLRCPSRLCMQDTLTDEMVGLAAGLKRNAAAMEGAVRERGRLLDGAETMLDGNLHGTQRSVRESKAVRTRRADHFKKPRVPC